MGSPATSAALISAARSGDQGAIITLLARSQPQIQRYARRSCRVDDIDDATQDALLILQRRIGALQSVLAYSSWLFQVVRRVCLRYARSTLHLHLAIDDFADDTALSSKPEAELRLDLAAAIQSLPVHYRDIVLLRDLEELTIDEIAATLHLSREAVKARLRRARQLLRDYLLGDEARALTTR